MSESTPNPYTQHKPWHTEDDVELQSADSLFVPDKQVVNQDPDDDSATLDPDSVNYKKRYDDLKKHYDRRINEFTQKIDNLEVQLKTSEPGYVPPKTPEEVEAYRQANTDTVEVVETMVHEKTQKLESELETLRAESKRLKAQEAKAYIKSVHPDVDTIKNDPDFHDWADDQAEEVRNWIYKNPDNGKLAAKAITLYKAEKGLISRPDTETHVNSDTNLEDAATLIPTRGTGNTQGNDPKIWTESEIRKMPMNVYERYEEEIDLAIAEGRVLMNR